MAAGKMHPHEVDIDAALVRRLLAAQFPHWADLPLAPVAAAGTDNALYRLGDTMVVRLPRREGGTDQVEKEHLWLPRLAPHLPLTIPAPLALGTPGEGYPTQWSVYRWLAGENATVAALADQAQAALALADFIAALQRITTTGWPPPGPPTSFRGGPLATRDAETRAAIAAVAVLDDTFDTAAAIAVWDAALQAPAWQGPPIWIHADLQPLNILVDLGRLNAVIDFGGLGLGDPACDVMAAWNLLPVAARELFRAALAVDDATWARGRGWALSFGLIALPYYHITNPSLAAVARRAIDEALADHHQVG